MITLIAGILLGLVYQITKEPIRKAEEEAQQEAYKAVFENAESFGEMKEFDKTAADKLLAESGYAEDAIDGVVTALDANGQILGYVISVTSSAGYGGNISFSVGIQMDGTLNGYEILSIGETAGLGMKATTDAFKSQFENKNVAAFNVTKGSAASDSEIEAISGATITSNAMTNGVNAALVYFNSLVEGGIANE